MASLQGKVALVTGASKGIGAAIARELAHRGAAVAVNYSGSQANLAEAGASERLASQTAAALGPIDILVNNAGVYEFAPIEAITPEHYHRQFDLNVLGLLLTTQAVLKHFSPEGGSIINIGSVAAAGVPTAVVYSATKGAVNSITGALAQELGPRKIRVNTISPGLIETEGVHAAGFLETDFAKKTIDETPLGRIGQPNDIATVAAFLASSDAGWVNGQFIEVSGGNRL
jgi:3-oxoacyl-[acyl-carrier protein] reductase